MCDKNCIAFGIKNLTEEDVRGKRILEVGSYDVNGSLRGGITAHKPDQYIGVDIEDGPGVDLVCKSEDIVKEFGQESFDIVLSTCTLEHVVNCKRSISQIKNVCKPGGIIVLIVPSKWPAHNHPVDYWRFSLVDIQTLFADCEILKIEEKPSIHGVKIGDLVYAKIRKPIEFKEKDISSYPLYHLPSEKKDMKTLAQIYAQHQDTMPGSADKGSIHSYIPVYDELLSPYRGCAKVLEIGLLAGKSLRMWEEYFNSAKVYGVDITDQHLKPMIAEGNHNIEIFNATDADEVERVFGDMKFDVIIEDASHALEDQMSLYQNFKGHLAEDGIYIIEDVDKLDQVRQRFLEMDPDKVIKIIDRRLVKHRFDDVLVVIGGIQDQRSKFHYIDNKFNQLCATPSDMQLHMPRILEYAAKCRTIVEFGVWDCTSTWALLAGKPKAMTSYDIVRRPEVDEVEKIAANSGIAFQFIKKSTLEVEIEECDLLFIDTYHSYDQLKAELALHSKKVRKIIMFHDTTTFGDHDQNKAGGHGDGRGLWPAIEEFLGDRSVWKGIVRHLDCNGLTIIERVGPDK